MAILRGIKFTSVLAALALFFAPWVEIRLAGQVTSTQTGIQTITGDATPGPGKQLDQESKSLDSAPLVGAALVAVVLSILLSAIAIKWDHALPQILGPALCALAMILLIAQCLQEFPAKQTIQDSISSDQATLDGEMGAFMVVMMMEELEIAILPVLYVVCGLLGVCVLLSLIPLLAELRLWKSSAASLLLVIGLVGCDQPSLSDGSEIRAEVDEKPSAIPEDFIQKWENIVIPSVNFEDTTVEDAIEFLRMRSAELDPEEDPTKKGVSWVVRTPTSENVDDASLQRALELSPEAAVTKINLRVKNMKMVDLIKEISEQAHLNCYLTSRCFIMMPEEQKLNPEVEREHGIEIWRVYREVKD
ncbi:MAG: hypothetical protein R3242_09225 [Akkermansiaceae bacterium]|nr:hypothetical protein [Akkermansiaceae bacterium]